ncbi:hypothetical protein LEMLEM_LOCUS8170 [Lemmus lemmus]
MYVKSVGRPSTRNEAQVDISGATLERSLISDRETPVWVPSRLTRTVENQEDRGDDTPLDAGVEQTTPKPSGTEMENPVCLP